MKLLFAHDHIFYKYKDNFYSTGGLSKEVLERYTEVFEEVTVISRHKEIDILDDKLTLASTERVKFVEIPNFKSIKSYSKFFEAKKIIEKEIESCDSLIARLPSSIGSLAISLSKKSKKSYLIEVVACPWDAYWNHSFKGKIIAPYMFLATRNHVKNAPNVIYVTNEFLQRRYPTRGINMGCSDVALPQLNHNILEKRLKKINNVSKSNPIILGTTAAVNVKYKGQQYVIEAISLLNKQGYNFEYHIVGGGDNSFLKSIAKKHGVSDKVKLLGSMSHKKVFEYLDNIDIYIQPSKQEGLPRALVEAMSRGCPSIGSTTGGIPELLNEQFIFSNGSVKEICEKLKKMDKKSMYKEAIRSFEKAKEYDYDKLDIKRKTFYQEFILDFKGGISNEL
ncbi:glycosyltransferase family 4 protein [Bacillus sp. 3103sda1]|uniref:glycosyltransferase n=1 Tax=Bacillus sp. 3103sda1 TaxID=2953808 RepID=UPI0020A079AA|nr:glycosyltransferase [Bacillus sp. 3103sda1]MCP1126095.1 glycosyltransferase family 4 protein [Bacillus sp. 3103sda1]